MANPRVPFRASIGDLPDRLEALVAPYFPEEKKEEKDQLIYQLLRTTRPDVFTDYTHRGSSELRGALAQLVRQVGHTGFVREMEPYLFSAPPAIQLALSRTLHAVFQMLEQEQSRARKARMGIPSYR